MILPKAVVGHNKVRDAKILDLYTSGNVHQSELSSRFELTPQRINKIIKRNASLVLQNTDFETVKRLEFIKEQLRREEVKNVVVPPDKWVELWRKEFSSEEKNVAVQNNFLVHFPAHSTNSPETEKVSIEPQDIVESDSGSINPNDEGHGT